MAVEKGFWISASIPILLTGGMFFFVPGDRVLRMALWGGVSLIHVLLLSFRGRRFVIEAAIVVVLLGLVATMLLFGAARLRERALRQQHGLLHTTPRRSDHSVGARAEPRRLQADMF